MGKVGRPRKINKEVKQEVIQEEIARNWGMIGYLDSLPADWREQIRKENIPFVVSPLHDKDVYDKDTIEHKKGELKKAHYHIMFCLEGKKTHTGMYELARKMLGEKAVSHIEAIERIHSAKGYVRYMLHLDDKDKYQYERKEIESYGGVDVEHLLKMTETQKQAYRMEIGQFIDDNDITSYAELEKIIRESSNQVWYEVLAGSTNHFKNILYDRRKELEYLTEYPKAEIAESAIEGLFYNYQKELTEQKKYDTLQDSKSH